MIQNFLKWISENPVKASAIAVALGAVAYVATNKKAQKMIGLSGTNQKTVSRNMGNRIRSRRLK